MTAPDQTNAEDTRAFQDPGHYTAKDREQIADEDFAGPDKSYPIVTPKDVADAAHLVGQATDKGAVKARIKAIAKRKGPEFEAHLPASWGEDADGDEDDRVALPAEVVRSATAPDAETEAPDLPERTTLYAPITRIDTERREIEVVATSEAVDSYGTVFDYEASKDAFARWAGNIREMHQPKAVGRRVAVLPDDEERKVRVRLRISKGAEDTWQKINDGTLTGASIGASKVNWVIPEDRAANGGKRIPVAKKYDLVELSLVDSPSNPDSQGISIIRMAELDGESALRADENMLDTLEDEAPVETAPQTAEPTPEPVADAVVELAAEPDEVRLGEPTDADGVTADAPKEKFGSGIPAVTADGWRPFEEDFATHIARQRMEQGRAQLAARRAQSPAEVTRVVDAAPVATPAPAAPVATKPQAVPGMPFIPKGYPDHIRAAAKAAGEAAVANLPAYQTGIGGEYTLYAANVARTRGLAEMEVFQAYKKGEAVAARLMAQAEVQRLDADGDDDGDQDEEKPGEDSDEQAPAKGAAAAPGAANPAANPAAAKKVAKQAVKQASADDDDAKSIPDDNERGAGIDAPDDGRSEVAEETREGGITTATGLTGYELNAPTKALTSTPQTGAAQRHRHAHSEDITLHSAHEHEHTHANGVTHSHPHVHPHGAAFDGGEHSHTHTHSHTFRNGEPSDSRLVAAETERKSLSMTGLGAGSFKNSGVDGGASAATTGNVKNQGNGASTLTKGLTPQKVGSLNITDTTDPSARDGGVPAPVEVEPTPEDITLENEAFHEGGHPGYPMGESKLDIDGDHDQPGDGDENENGKQGEADSVNHSAEDDLGATPSAVSHAGSTPKGRENAGITTPHVPGGGQGRTPQAKSAGVTGIGRAEEDPEEVRIGARISTASKAKLHSMRDAHVRGVLDATELCGCPECLGHRAIMGAGNVDADGDHDAGDVPSRAALASITRYVTQSQAEHLEAMRTMLADALAMVDTRLHDHELSVQDATSNLTASVQSVQETRSQQAQPAPVPTVDVAALQQSMSEMIERMQTAVLERVNAVASVADELQSTVERIAAMPAPEAPTGAQGVTAAQKLLPYQNAEAVRNAQPQQSPLDPRAIAIAEIQRKAQQGGLTVQQQLAAAETIMAMQGNR